MPIRRVKMNVDILMDIPGIKGDTLSFEEEGFVKKVLSKSIKESSPNDLDFPISIEIPIVEVENRTFDVQCLKIVEGYPEGWDRGSSVYQDSESERTVDQILNKKYYRILQIDLMEDDFCLCSKQKK